MATIKRSLSTSPVSDYVLTPAASESDDSKPSSPPAKKAKKSPAKVKCPRKPKTDQADGEKERNKPRVWTAGEDAIFVELIDSVVKQHLWSKVKEDGRLAFRGQPGITAHMKSVMTKMKHGQVKQ